MDTHLVFQTIVMGVQGELAPSSGLVLHPGSVFVNQAGRGWRFAIALIASMLGYLGLALGAWGLVRGARVYRVHRWRRRRALARRAARKSGSKDDAKAGERPRARRKKIEPNDPAAQALWGQALDTLWTANYDPPLPGWVWEAARQRPDTPGARRRAKTADGDTAEEQVTPLNERERKLRREAMETAAAHTREQVRQSRLAALTALAPDAPTARRLAAEADAYAAIMEIQALRPANDRGD